MIVIVKGQQVGKHGTPHKIGGKVDFTLAIHSLQRKACERRSHAIVIYKTGFAPVIHPMHMVALVWQPTPVKETLLAKSLSTFWLLMDTKYRQQLDCVYVLAHCHKSQSIPCTIFMFLIYP